MGKRRGMLTGFFLGFVRIHILHHACEEPIYGVGIMEELGRHGYQLRPGTLYPILHDLKKQGYLEDLEEVVEGKVRRYYEACPRWPNRPRGGQEEDQGTGGKSWARNSP